VAPVAGPPKLTFVCIAASQVHVSLTDDDIVEAIMFSAPRSQ
jgi:hypothetical protein